MSEITRRDALNRLAAAFAAAGLVDRIAAREVHAAVAQAGAAGPKSLTTAQCLAVPPSPNLTPRILIGVVSRQARQL